MERYLADVRARRAWLWLAMFACAIGCEPPSQDPAAAKRNFAMFRDEVYPVLLRDCGFAACHGDANRFFRVWGPGRERLPGAMTTPDPFDLPTVDEWSASFSLAEAFIDSSRPEASDLIRKPLAIEAGGVSHAGVDPFGRNVYRTRRDSGWLALVAWLQSAPPE